jgi:protease-4
MHRFGLSWDTRKKLGKLHTPAILVTTFVLAILASSLLISQPKVGVIKVGTSIMSMETARDIVKMLRYAKEDKNIKAVMLEINSPGGEVTAIEEIYLNILDLKKEKPVVASIDQLGASGAYYIAVASNLIYAKPDSSVGGIGVISRLPSPEELDEDTITTGPFKVTGFSRRDFTYRVGMAQETFLNAIILQRGEKLKISKEELSKAGIYGALDGLRLGLIDNIGSNFDAIEKAARMAGIANYEIIDINEKLKISFGAHSTYVNTSLLGRTNTVPINYYLYLELG